MKKSYGILAAAALAVGGMAMVGCHNNNPDTNPSASNIGVGGGGSTDSYGTGPDARLRSTGNIGVNTGGDVTNNGVTPQPAAVSERPTQTQPPQTPIAPGGGTGGAGSGTYAPGNGGTQGSANPAGANGNNAGAPNGLSNNGTPQPRPGPGQ